MASAATATATTNLTNIVEGQTILKIHEFTLESGVVVKDMPVAYKTWGKLSDTASNVMVICHALTGSADVDDWWGPLLGPGRAFDTDNFFIFCGNVLGSPYGSFSPLTINPATGKKYGPEFPLVSIRDDVRAHKFVLDTLGVKQVQYVIGGSMGGMQVLEWAFFGADYIKNIAPIATSGRHSAWCISWGEAQRQAIYSDPNYADGYYTPDKVPNQGLAAARMAALLTYRSRNSFEARFGRKTLPSKPVESEKAAAVYHNEGNKVRLHYSKGEQLPQDSDNSSTTTEKKPQTPPPQQQVFSAQSYLRYQGDKFIKRFDANCYIALTRKMDTHDISRGRGEFEKVLESLQQNALVIGIETDGLFTISEQYELSEHIPNSEIVIIHSFEGHDGFLLEFDQMNKHLSAFIKKRTPEYAPTTAVAPLMKEEKASLFGEAEGADVLMW
ncbi:homoserine O- acetyltransferase [Chytridiales sp. JEL 0842]|nr:homoserine O- acetyltransferase [Chytridiales sp. JEL 0842]